MTTSLLIPFIGLIILSMMADKLTYALQLGMKKVPFLPDEIEKPIAYLIVFAVGFVACWRGHYSLFGALEFTFEHEYEGWIFTALVISGGSAFLRESFGTMETMPGFLSSAYGYVKRLASPVATTATPSVENETEMKQGQETQV